MLAALSQIMGRLWNVSQQKGASYKTEQRRCQGSEVLSTGAVKLVVSGKSYDDRDLFNEVSAPFQVSAVCKVCTS